MSNKYVSGIRPSGQLHLGNYLGAIKQWKALQDSKEECFFFVADLHGQYTHNEIFGTVTALEKCGIKQAAIQSWAMPQLLELMHELSFYANTSRLDNMTQYKEKGGTLALYAYPVLMAADVLYHEATHVPIGNDQRQHLELVRELARKVGRKEPIAVINPVGSRIMSLSDPLRKMSKSDIDENGCIYLSDDKDVIAKKVKAAVSTDAGIKNMMEIIKALGGEFEYTGRNDALKKCLTDSIIGEICHS